MVVLNEELGLNMFELSLMLFISLPSISVLHKFFSNIGHDEWKQFIEIRLPKATQNNHILQCFNLLKSRGFDVRRLI